jgi:hypothetical protein
MLQFPTPPPSGDVPPMTSFEHLVTCFLIVTMGVFLFSMLLPRPWFEWVFKTALPFMPDKLEDFDDR